MAKRSKLPRMPSGDARSFAAIPRLEARVDAVEARLDEHEERLDVDDERLDHHEALLAEVERDLGTLRQLGVRSAEREAERERASLVRRRRSRPRSDRG